MDDILQAALADAGITPTELEPPAPTPPPPDPPRPKVRLRPPIGQQTVQGLRMIVRTRDPRSSYKPLLCAHPVPRPPIRVVASTGLRPALPHSHSTASRGTLMRPPITMVRSSPPVHQQPSGPLVRVVPAQQPRTLPPISSTARRTLAQQQQQQQKQPAQKPAPQMREVLQVQEELEDDEKIIQVDTFTEYVPQKLRSGLPHPDPVVETASLSSVAAPDIRYNKMIPDTLSDEGKISALQLEAVIYACQAHESKLPSGERVGYLIGDGAGVGKGRTIATIIYENLLHGRKRAIWISVSSDLVYDARRDLRDIGADIDVYPLNELKYAPINGDENGNIRRGVVFSTYSSLICECKQKTQENGEGSSGSQRITSRLNQLIQWFGRDYDGLIIFDECHHAKNLVPSAGSKPTKTGRYVLEIQKALPNARVIYASATGASEPRNMAYMTRLGLWGPQQTFCTFNDFINAVEQRGVGAMELVAMDMKLRGLYLARQLSFKGVDFSVQEVYLTPEFVHIYDESVKLWMECRRQFQYAIEHTKSDDRYQRSTWAHFWSAHQRFFKYLCIGAKVQACVAVSKRALEEGKCVVIGLQSTGEAQMMGALEEAGGELTDFVSTTKAVLQSLIEKYFPTGDSDGSDMLGDIGRMFTIGSMGAGGADSQRRRRGGTAFNHSTLPALIRRPARNASNGSVDRNEESSDADSEEEDENDEHPAKRRRMDERFDPDASDDEDGLDDDDDEEDLSDVDSTTDDGEESFSKPSTAPPPPASDVRNPFLNMLMAELEDFPTEVNPFDHDFSNADDPWAHLQSHQEDLAEAERRREREAFEAQERAKKERRKRRRRARKRQERREKRKREEEAAEARRLELERRIQDQLQNGTGTAEEFMEASRVIDNSIVERDSVSLLMIKTELLAAVERLGQKLPPNTLDQLIDELGGPSHVAEMTGRRNRIVTLPNGQVEYQKRNADSDASLELMNMEEKEMFMRGDKLIAVISEAASSGISLQADKRVANQCRRVHITLELPWSADKAVQQFGRTHRSNQTSAPEYLFLISELAGEKRFASAVAKRLECLGALTHGDRRAAESRDLSQFNLDNKYGRQALQHMVRALAEPNEKPFLPAPSSYPIGAEHFFSDMRQYLVGVGVLSVPENHPRSFIVEKEGTSLAKFLNRLLGLPVHAQNALFSYFTEITNELIRQAKSFGVFDKGIKDLGSGTDRAKKIEQRSFRGYCNNANFVVEMHKIAAERGLKWEEALQEFEHHKDKDDACGFYLSKAKHHQRQMPVLIVSMGRDKHLNIVRPNTGRSMKPMTKAAINSKFQRISKEEAQKRWSEAYEALGKMCLHRFLFNQCKDEATVFCEVGRRVRTYFVLTGSVIAVWPLLEKAMEEGRAEKSDKHNRTASMQIVRIRTDDNQKLVGLQVLPKDIRTILQTLNSLNQPGGLPTQEAAR